ncbi:aromatic ring-hydroxylating oxygenase subunit alpha [Peredibacter starrii]|uniref:SRPBCC family protein n=1 Tax=Peredibacter starrii TaxID=28202 RepID=A0AAX4HK32_9BACT|nr:SRPBCC family protein [Peredibacter starrii]WPU63556.1 SRPBCC family protein [Peredibacter starrii]
MLVELKSGLLEHMKKQKEDPHLPRNFSLPTSNYYSFEIFDKEMAALKNTFQIHGPESEFLKNSKGQFFKNSCPHRGARLAIKGDEFVCSYHGWSFDQEGLLKSSTGHICPYKPGSLRLLTMDSITLGGMAYTGEKPEFFEEITVLSKTSEFLEKRDFEIKSNWKFLVESLLETYHFPFAHHSILGNFENAYFSMNERRGNNSRTMVPLNDLNSSRDEENLKGINIMYFIFPFAFALFMNSGFVWFIIEPLTVDKSILRTYLFSYGNDRTTAIQSLEILDKILHQDFDVLEGQQANATVFKRHFLTGHEDLIRMFHENLSISLSRQDCNRQTHDRNYSE